MALISSHPRSVAIVERLSRAHLRKALHYRAGLDTAAAAVADGPRMLIITCRSASLFATLQGARSMPLTGTVQPIPNGAHGFDANSVLTAQQCTDAKAMGFAFAIRYVGRGAVNGAGNLTAAEAQRILSAALGLMAVQHVAQQGWTPTAALGQTNGANAAAHATSVGFPAGVNLWVDLEGINHRTSAEDVIAYCNAWCAEAAQAGFVPGVYVGANAILTADQLYWRLQVKHYWKSGSIVPHIPHRGYQLVQRIVRGDTPFGVEIDRNVAMNDSIGNAALMLA